MVVHRAGQAQAEGLEGFTHRITQGEAFRVQLQFARLNLREVQDVVDQMEEVVRRISDGTEIAALLGGKR